MPRVSVVLPNYNYARYLRERVRSVLYQTMEDFELIYIDDASKDESNQVMETFASDPRVRMTLHTQNSGMVYKRWNDGAAMATGDWLWFAGADDSAHPQFLEKLLALADANPSAAIVHSSCLLMDGQGALIGLGAYGDDLPSAHLAQSHCVQGHEEAIRLMEWCHLLTASAMLLRRDAFEAAGGFEIRLWQAADWDLYLSMLRHHDIAYTTEPLATFRKHAQTVSSGSGSLVHFLEGVCCMTRAFRWMRDDPRISPQVCKALQQRIEAFLFDIFAVQDVVIPRKIRFAAEAVYEVFPDKRLLEHIEK